MSMHDAGYKLTSDTPANWDDEEDEWDTDYALSAIEGIKAEVAKGTPDPAVEGIPSTIEAYKTKVSDHMTFCYTSTLRITVNIGKGFTVRVHALFKNHRKESKTLKIARCMSRLFTSAQAGS